MRVIYLAAGRDGIRERQREVGRKGGWWMISGQLLWHPAAAAPLMRLDKMETYAEILVTVCILCILLSLSVSHPLPLARLTRPDCLRPLKHLFQLALPSWPGVLNLACVISILLLIKKRKKETKPCRHGSGKGAKALYKTEMWQTLNWIVRVCEGESYEAGGENSSKWNREIEREKQRLCISSVISHLPHREKSQYLISLLIWMMSSAV